MVYGGEMKSITEKILEKYNEYDIFRYYIGTDFIIGKTIRSPLRKDNNPSFTIYHSPYSKTKLKYKDFSNGEQGSCFDFVARKYNTDFSGAVKIIRSDFELGFKDPTRNLPTQGYSGIHYEGVEISKLKSETIIECTFRQWNKTTDKHYWYDQYHLSCTTLKKYNVYPCTHVWLNGKVIAVENKISPIYGFYFGLEDGCCKELWKVLIPYAPNRSGNKDSKNRFKWLTNCPKTIMQGYDQLPWLGDLIIITKSLKDVMVLDSMGYNAIASHSETDKFDVEFIEKIRKRFSKIVVFYDNDKAGMSGALGMCNKHKDLSSIIIPVDTGIKDISDYVKKYGIDMSKQLMNQLINEIQEKSLTSQGTSATLGNA